MKKVFKDKWRLHLSKRRITFIITMKDEYLTKGIQSRTTGIYDSQ